MGRLGIESEQLCVAQSGDPALEVRPCRDGLIAALDDRQRVRSWSYAGAARDVSPGTRPGATRRRSVRSGTIRDSRVTGQRPPLGPSRTGGHSRARTLATIQLSQQRTQLIARVQLAQLLGIRRARNQLLR